MRWPDLSTLGLTLRLGYDANSERLFYRLAPMTGTDDPLVRARSRFLNGLLSTRTGFLWRPEAVFGWVTPETRTALRKQVAEYALPCSVVAVIDLFVPGTSLDTVARYEAIWDQAAARDPEPDSERPQVLQGRTEADGPIGPVSAEAETGDPQPVNPASLFVLPPEWISWDTFAPALRAQRNSEALAMLQRLRTGPDRTPATEADARALAGYAGWGGLAAAMEPKVMAQALRDPEACLRAGNWPARSAGALVTALRARYPEPNRLNAAAHLLIESTANAHYTAAPIIEAMWAAVRSAGFAGGNVLEPSCGIGHFLGLMPEDLRRRSRVTAVEMEPFAAEIAGLLYPEVRVINQPFQEVALPATFDLVMGNVPFGNNEVFDSIDGRIYSSLHDYFIQRALKLAKPGGIVAVLTSRYTLDKAAPGARMEMGTMATLLGSVRLPAHSQKAQAGTEVVEDLLLFRRSGRGHVADTRFLDAHVPPEDSGIYEDYNDWYHRHPDAVLGRLSDEHSYARRLWVTSEDSVETVASRALDVLRQQIEQAPAPEVTQEPDHTDHRHHGSVQRPIEEDLQGELMTGSLVTLPGGGIGRITKQRGPAADVDPVFGPEDPSTATLSALLPIRDALIRVIGDQGNDVARARLNAVYDEFVRGFGPLNAWSNKRLMAADPHAWRLLAIERVSVDQRMARSPVVEKADIFFRPVIQSVSWAGWRGRAASVHDAVLLSQVLRTSLFDEERLVQDVTHFMGDAAVVATAGDLLSRQIVFRDPATDRLVLAETYLSGDVGAKLRMAESRARADAAFRGNVHALKAVAPEPLLPGEIHAEIGASWIPREVMAQFLGYLQDRYRAEFREESGRKNPSVPEEFDGLFYDEAVGWVCDLPRFGMVVPPEFSTARMPFISLLPKILRREEIAVYDTDFDKRRILNRDETQAAMAAADRIREAFVQFLWADAERSERIAKQYNERFNRWVAPSYQVPGDAIYPGMSEEYMALLYPTQRNAIMRCAVEGRGLIAHEVGMGKTIVQVAAAMELRRNGRARRPVLVVKKSTLVQFSQTAQWLYPNARFLIMSHEDLAKDRRAQFLAQAASNDYDAIVMTHEVFGRLRVSREQFESVLLEEVSSLRTALERLRGAGARRMTVKSIALRISTLKARMQKAADESKKDPGLLMDRDLGIDALFVDEAHLYKNMGSARSMDLLVKTRVIHRTRGGDRMGVFLSTGTPVSNSLNEIHTMWNYIAPDQLEAMGIATLPAFRSTFIGEKAHWEPHHAGAGWRIRTRDLLVNAPDVIRGLLTVMDRKTVDRDAADTIRRPGHAVVTVEVPMTSSQQKVMEEVASAAMNPDKNGSGHIFSLMDRAAKCSTDMRLLDDGLDGVPREYMIEDGSKLPSICDRVVEIYNRGADVSGAQMVFLDQGTPGGDGPNLYESLKTLLVGRGIPEDAIALIHDATTDLARAALFDRVNSGTVRVLIGSTGKMGEGVNAQERLSAVHIASPPWRPDIVEQAIGRAVRQGNIHKEVTTLFYSSVSRAGAVSPDAFRYQLLQTKLTAFAALLRGDMTDRTFSLDVAMTYGEIAAAASGNPMVLEKFRAEQATEEALSHLRFLMNDRSRLMIEIGTLDGGIAWKTRRRTYFDAFPRLRGESQAWTYLDGDRETVFDHREAMEAFLKKHAAAESKRDATGDTGFSPQPARFRLNGILINRKRAVGADGELVRGHYYWGVDLLRTVEHPDSGVSVRSARYKSLDALLAALTPEAILAECERMDREVSAAETRKREVKARIAGLSDGEIPAARQRVAETRARLSEIEAVLGSSRGTPPITPEPILVDQEEEVSALRTGTSSQSRVRRPGI